MLTRTATIVRMVDLPKKKKNRHSTFFIQEQSRNSFAKKIDKYGHFSKNHQRKGSEKHIQLNNVIKKNLTQKLPPRISSSSTRLNSLKLARLDSKKNDSSLEEYETPFKKIKYHSIRNTPMRKKSLNLRPLPMLPNVRDLLLPPALQKKNKYRTCSHQRNDLGLTPLQKRSAGMNLKLDTNLMKKISAPNSSDHVPSDKAFSLNSKPPLSAQLKNTTSGKSKEKALLFLPHNFKIKNKANCNSLIQSLLKRSVEYRKKFDTSVRLPKLNQNSM
ncbi:unnamed protein product [Moneuplotes crassus]|uniref:Uncharacterized protein n=1 Tax=Euplotes crassus TaxID=5936 RepID=A0AAD1XBU4_EUPCR|nr:unnamed protein product [Moneuplotes crassus]